MAEKLCHDEFKVGDVVLEIMGFTPYEILTVFDGESYDFRRLSDGSVVNKGKHLAEKRYVKIDHFDTPISEI